VADELGALARLALDADVVRYACGEFIPTRRRVEAEEVLEPYAAVRGLSQEYRLREI